MRLLAATGEFNALAVGVFACVLALTLVITRWAAKRTHSATEFYAAGRGVSGRRQRRRHRRRLPQRLDLPRLRRPDVPVRLRRLDHRPRRLPVVPARALPARRADAQRGQVHRRRRALVPPEGAARACRHGDQHAADLGHLPGRAARRRGRRDRGPGGHQLPGRGADLRRLHGRLRRLRRHAGDDLGADHQGRDADGRGHRRRRRGPGEVQLQPGPAARHARPPTTPTATRSSARART